MVKHGGRVVWTIGYDNLSKDAFLDLLKDHRIEVLMDVSSVLKGNLEKRNGEIHKNGGS